MIFIINNLKYDTDKMDLVSDKVVYRYPNKLFSLIQCIGEDVKLWKSKHNRWLLTHSDGIDYYGKAVDEDEVKQMLAAYDLIKYEEIFGEIEEA